MESEKVDDENTVITSLKKLLAVFIKKRVPEDFLEQLGCEKASVDIMVQSIIKSSGKTPFHDDSVSELQNLEKNIFLLLECTIPKKYIEEFTVAELHIEDILEYLIVTI